jgi:long-chain acyl-CoA synthetase
MTAPATLNHLFLEGVERHGHKPAALRYKTGGAWQALTHAEVARRVRTVALALRDVGLDPGDRVAILSENRPEWLIADYGCLAARLADVPVYPTLPPKQIAYILRDSAAKGIFVSTAEQLAKVHEIRAELPALDFIVAFDGDGTGAGVTTLAAFEARGAAVEDKYPSHQTESLAVDPDALSTLIYTSGTTGDPKGVMLTHKNFCTNVVGTLSRLDVSPADECLSFLPLSHSFERMADYALWLAGLTINYAESIETVPQNMVEVRPTVMLSVPRLYEKMYARVLEAAMAGSAVKQAIFRWAKRTAEAWAEYSLAGRPRPGLLDAKRALADRLVFAKVKARTGGRLRFFVSGGAPLSPTIAKFFYAAGLPIVEGYGLTETSPVLTVNPLDGIRIGSVGTPIPGVEIQIAPDGEILARGPNIMQGYWNKPDATRETIDTDGWLHTGDIGELDADGYLRITDRKKDIIVTATGKNIAPQPIENMVKTNKFVANAVMLGDKRKFPIILLVPNLEQLRPWADDRGLVFTDDRSLIDLSEVQAKMEREVMGQLRDLAKFEMPKRVILLEKDFTIESGELTPTLKVKRRIVERRHREAIDEAYAGETVTVE